MPGNGKQDAAVGGARNHQRCFTRQKLTRQNDVTALTDGENFLGLRFIHLPKIVGENASGVDDDFRLALKAGATFAVFDFDAAYLAAGLEKADHRCVIQREAALIEYGPQQRNGKAGIVKLAVVIKDATFQAVVHDGRQRGLNAIFERMRERPRPLCRQGRHTWLDPRRKTEIPTRHMPEQ